LSKISIKELKDRKRGEKDVIIKIDKLMKIFIHQLIIQR